MMQIGACRQENLDGVEIRGKFLARRARILVVDDDEAVRSAFALAFCGLGYDLALAENGFEALQYIERNLVDVVFLDLRMPGIDGVRTLRVVRQLRPDAKLCIVSAFIEEHMSSLIDAASESMDFELFRKPLGIDEIRALAATLLEPTRSGKHLAVSSVPSVLGRKIANKRTRLPELN